MSIDRVKFLEIRDRMTFIPAAAVDCSFVIDNYEEGYLLSRAGYGRDRCILLTALGGGVVAEYAIYAWKNRTYQVAHQHIIAHWDTLKTGDVIDVEYILGETKEKKCSERYNER